MGMRTFVCPVFYGPSPLDVQKTTQPPTKPNRGRANTIPRTYVNKYIRVATFCPLLAMHVRPVAGWLAVQSVSMVVDSVDPAMLSLPVRGFH